MTGTSSRLSKSVFAPVVIISIVMFNPFHICGSKWKPVHDLDYYLHAGFHPADMSCFVSFAEVERWEELISENGGVVVSTL